MSNADVARRVIELAFNKGDLTVLDDLVDPSYVEHQRLPEGIPPTVDALRAIIGDLRSGFSNFRLVIERIDEVGDYVWLRMRGTGTQDGEFMGMPPSGRRIEVDVFDLVRIEGGKIVEHWGVPDQLAVMEQLGALDDVAGP